MRFDVVNYLSDEGIYYRSSGENCAKDHVVIDCPFCGNDDGQHLGIDTFTGAWGCWRNEDHRGRSLIKLVSALSGVNSREARSILGYTDGPSAELIGAFDVFSEDPAAFFNDAPVETVEKDSLKLISLPEGVKPLTPSRRTDPFYDYLIDNRGFKERDVDAVIEAYDLHYALDGDQAYRLVMPVYIDGKLTSWTGRAIGHSTLRYKSTKKDDCLVNIYDSLGGYDDLMNTKGELLILAEGPLDYMKTDFYARRFNCRATCIFSKHVSDIQMSYIADVAGNFKKVLIALDPEEFHDALKLESKLSFLPNVSIATYPKNIEDLGALSPRQIQSFINDNLKINL